MRFSMPKRWRFLGVLVALACSTTLFAVGVKESFATSLLGVSAIFFFAVGMVYGIFQDRRIDEVSTSKEVVNVALTSYVIFLLFSVWTAASNISAALLLAIPGIFTVFKAYSSRATESLANVLTILQYDLAGETPAAEDNDYELDYEDGFAYGYREGFKDGLDRAPEPSDDKLGEMAEIAKEIEEAELENKKDDEGAE